MKKIIILIILSIISLGLITGCSTTQNTKILTNKEQTSTTVKEQDIREVAYNQLTSMDKERIAGTFKDAKLSKITLTTIRKVNPPSSIGGDNYLDNETSVGVKLSSEVVKNSIEDDALKEGMGNITDKSYIGKEVYLVDFPTKSKSIPNNIIVYLSIDNNKLLGYGYVD